MASFPLTEVVAHTTVPSLSIDKPQSSSKMSCEKIFSNVLIGCDAVLSVGGLTLGLYSIVSISLATTNQSIIYQLGLSVLGFSTTILSAANAIWIWNITPKKLLEDNVEDLKKQVLTYHNLNEQLQGELDAHKKDNEDFKNSLAEAKRTMDEFEAENTEATHSLDEIALKFLVVQKSYENFKIIQERYEKNIKMLQSIIDATIEKYPKFKDQLEKLSGLSDELKEDEDNLELELNKIKENNLQVNEIIEKGLVLNQTLEKTNVILRSLPQIMLDESQQEGTFAKDVESLVPQTKELKKLNDQMDQLNKDANKTQKSYLDTLKKLEELSKLKENADQ